jgi:hypothetical protein
MNATTKSRSDEPLSAAPSEADFAAWDALSREEQVRAYREALTHPDCVAPSGETMDNIVVAAGQRIASRHA